MKNQSRRAAVGIHLESDLHIGVRNKVAPLTLRVETNQRRQRPEKPERVAAAFDDEDHVGRRLILSGVKIEQLWIDRDLLTRLRNLWLGMRVTWPQEVHGDVIRAIGAVGQNHHSDARLGVISHGTGEPEGVAAMGHHLVLPSTKNPPAE